jgi:hypothetical protein
MPRPAVRDDAHAQGLQRQAPLGELEGVQPCRHARAVGRECIQLVDGRLGLRELAVEVGDAGLELLLFPLGPGDLLLDELPRKAVVLGCGVAVE